MKEKLKQIFTSIKKSTLRPRGVQWIMVFTIAAIAVMAIDQLSEIPQVLAQLNSANQPTTQTGASGDVVGALGRGLGTAVSGLATLFFKLIAGILFFVLKWMGPLMDNSFILEGEIGVKIRTVWVIVRNFVNIFFALALVVVALMSVIGIGDESGNYAMKKFIPKMALALIAVNFTFLACRIVLDVNNVLTTAIFSIPRSVTTVGQIGPTGVSSQLIFKKMDCFNNSKNLSDETKRVANLEKRFSGVIASVGGVCFAEEPDVDNYKTLRDRGLRPQENPGKQAIISMDESLFTKHDFIWVMATQFQGIHDLNKVSTLLDPTFSGLTVNALFSAVFAVIYATAYISMFIILIARMAVLWVTIMLSPLVAINIVFPELKIQDFDIKEQFLSHAFVPAKMAVPMALGFIMLSQMTLSVHSGDAIFQQQVLDITGGEFARGVSFTTLLYGAASVAVLWMGVFAATKGVVGENLVSGFSDSIKGIGRTVAKWPTYLPIVPVHGGMSVQNMKYAMSNLSDRIEAQQLKTHRAKAESLWGKYFPSAEIQEAIESVERAAQDRRIDYGKLGVIMSNADKSVAATTLVKVLESKVTDEDKNKLAGMVPGYAGNFGKLLTDAKKGGSTMINIQEHLSKNLATGGGDTTRTTGPNYTGLLEDLKGLDNEIKLEQKFFENLPENTRKVLKNRTIKVSSFTPEEFITAIKDKGINGDEFGTLIEKGMLAELVKTKKGVTNEMSKDMNLMVKFAQAVSSKDDDKSRKRNEELKKTFMAITGAKNDEDLKKLPGTLGTYGEKLSRIDIGTGVYKEKK